MTDYSAVLTALYPNARAGIDNNDYSTLRWDESNTGPFPTQEELDAAWPSVQEANAWAEVRRNRDRLLAACDWTQVADAPVDSAPWAVYRQTLRDIPQTFNLPDNVVWPETP